MMFRSMRVAAAAGLALLLALPAGSQQDPTETPQPPPPLPPREKRKDGKDVGAGEEIRPTSEEEWTLPAGMIEKLAERVAVYREYAVRFECIETVRSADYDGGTVDSEKVRNYRYLLERDETGGRLTEFRQRLTREGQPKGGAVDDSDPFPPAYAWVYLFSDFNQPYFTYRYLGERLEGFDWVREIQFRGALGFTDGRDIRQWEGTVLVDAATYTPIEINAQPRAQDERLKAEYDRWARSFGFMGWKAGKKPLAYRARLQYRLRRDGLTFPTELRYDTLRAVSPDSMISVRASLRSYEAYRFYKATTRDIFDGGAGGSN